MRLNNPTLENIVFSRRVYLGVIIIALITIGMLAHLFDLQVIKYRYYAQQSLDNQQISLPIASTRGKIFDRNGQLLADNELSYQLSIIIEKTPNIEALLQELLTLKIISPRQLKRFNKRRKYYKKFQEIPLANSLNEQQMTKILVSQSYPSLNIKPYFKRIYPTKETMAHIIGYVGRINKKEQKKYNTADYKGQTHVGKIGIEKQYESILHGIPGKQSVIRNSSGRSIDSNIVSPAIAGSDLHLSIDLNLQQKALELLGDNKGSIVMVMVDTGEVLTLASAPGFDTNLFVDGISVKKYTQLRNDKNKPLFNRAIKGIYPPGSTIKPFMALAGIESNIIKPDYHLFCKGWYQLPNHNHKYRDWKKNGHGHVNLQSSIAQSCDVFFYDIANKMGISIMHKQLSKFKFGQKTNIDLPGEFSGVLPSVAWKKAKRNKPWYQGETIITGIGQGFMGTTPLQLAVSTAALAAQGKFIQPHLLKSSREPDGTISNHKRITHNLAINDISNYQLVIDGMKQTIYGKKGTARRLNKNLNYTMAGKTGTAQVFSLRRDETYVEKDVAKHLRDHALFTGFAPIESPKVAIAVIVENAGSGSAHAAPIAKKMFDAYFADLDK